jgi:multidrug resistance efflux pump
MTISALRSRPRPDNLKNQPRKSQSLARRIYLGVLLTGVTWIGGQIVGSFLFIDADGMIVQDRKLVGADYTAQVLSLSARPGDHVSAGQRIGTVVSTQMIDLVSDLSTRQAAAKSRQEQIAARLKAIASILPAADQRATESEAALAAVEKAAQAGYTTITRRAELSLARYDAMRETASLRAEAASLESERSAVDGNLQRIETALGDVRMTYHDGAIVAPVDGIVGPRVAAPGAVLKPGETVAEIYYGDKYVLAYLPTGRFYSVKTGDNVVVRDGGTSRSGRVERVEGLADTLPGEFQSNFRSVERRQVVRIGIGGSDMFPLLAKVNVYDVFSPPNMVAAARDGVGAMAMSLTRTSPAVASDR